MAERNLWEMGTSIANNPSAWSRVKHSSKGTSLRRAAKKSSVGAVLGSAATYALKQIPIPIIKDILAEASKRIYGAAVTFSHKKNLEKANNLEGYVKFSWKELNVQDVDRYRWKIKDALDELNKISTSYSTDINKGIESRSVCNRVVNATAQAAYARKRIYKLRQKVSALGTICCLTSDWLNECESRLDEWMRQNKEYISESLKIATKMYPDAHQKCTKEVCAFSESQHFRMKHGSEMDIASLTTSVIANSIDPTAYVKFSSPSLNLKTDNPWTGENYDPK